jgi:hypothetical protein
VVQQNISAGAQTMLTFKIEQSNVSEFFGQKGKDTISAIVFIRRIDHLARSNNWNDTTTYMNVANTLRGFASDWLFTTVKMYDWEGDQLFWTNLKPRFQHQFAMQSDDKVIINGLSKMAMNETRQWASCWQESPTQW